eukprot:2583659-Pyramimonas_sp.AAC.1
MTNGLHKVPPRPISGRWGSIRDCERHILQCDETLLRQVFTAAFGVAREGDDLRGAPTTGLNELELEEKGAYQAKMGKYATDGLKALRDDGFWLALR